MKKNQPLLSFLLFFSLIVSGQSTSSIREDGTVVVNGKVIFPFGFYNLHWTQPFDDKMKYLEIMLKAGFNVNFMEDAFVTDFYKFLDKTESYNSFMMVGPSNSVGNGFMDHVLYRHTNHNALLGWSLFDDGDDGRVSAAEITERNDYTKKNDPNHLTFLTLTGYAKERRDNRETFQKLTDASGLQVYPVGQKWSYYYEYGGNPLVESYYMTKNYVETATKNKKALIASSQTAIIPDVDPAIYPAVSELRNMMYGQIAAGAKGILSYDFSVDLYDNHRDLWDECVAINNEVQNTLKNPILDGERTIYVTNDSEFYTTYWKYNNELYVILINASYDTDKFPYVNIPAEFDGEMTPLFDRLNNTLSYGNRGADGNRISGTLAARAVNIYKISKRNLSSNKFENNELAGFKVAPNPIKKGNDFTIEYNNSSNQKEGLIEILTLNGAKIAEEKVTLNQGVNSINVSSQKLTNSGTYLLNFECKGKEKVTKKIIID
jgi:Secretion system C-terminal sorting domain